MKKQVRIEQFSMQVPVCAARRRSREQIYKAGDFSVCSDCRRQLTAARTTMRALFGKGSRSGPPRHDADA